MFTIKLVLLALGSYLLGSVSFSIFLSRLRGQDVRTKGSGNAGATNMARVYGMGMGVVTLLGDAFKAGLAVYIGWKLIGDWGIFVGGIFSLLGHCFPVLHHFKGGKGISSGAAIALAIDWRVFLTVVAVFAAAAVPSKKVSLGSVCAAISIFISSLIFKVSFPRLLLALLGMLLVVFQHRENIRRLINGTEGDFHAAHAPSHSEAGVGFEKVE